MKIAVFDSKPYDREFLGEAAKGTPVDWVFHEFRLSVENAAVLRGEQAVCLFVNDRADRECLVALKRAGVRHLALRCAGFNNVDLPAARELGLSVTRVPAYSPHAVAEHAVALLMTLNRKIHRAYNRVREHNFSLNGLLGFDVFGKTVGILGTGKIGKLTAEIFLGFKARVVVSDKFPDAEWASRLGIPYVSQKELLRQSDIVSLHIPLTPESNHLIDQKTLAIMKPGAFLINTSRGKLVDTTSLIEALKSGSLGGVALDVYEEEEGVFFEDLSNQTLEDDDLARLLTFPNVLVTAHQAFFTKEALGEIARVTVENLQRLQSSSPFLPGTTL